MGFIYPRKIAITRPPLQVSAGDQGYATALPAEEQSVASNIAASIQQSKSGSKNPVDLPGDSNLSNYRIFFRHSDRSLVKDRDIVTDDLGNRYQVNTAYWDSMGYRLEALQLET